MLLSKLLTTINIAVGTTRKFDESTLRSDHLDLAAFVMLRRWLRTFGAAMRPQHHYRPVADERQIPLDSFELDHDDADDYTESSPLDESDEELSNLRPFPTDPSDPVEDSELTIRALVIGCMLGAVVSASNIYLGLKTGWTFGSSLFGAILGYAILKPLTRYAPRYIGSSFGPKENVCIQSAATASGGLGIIFIGAIPAMYQLDLLGASPKADFWKLIGLTCCTAFFGIFFAIGLRKFYILKLKLIFPTPTAVAHVIRALHKGGKDAEDDARRKALVLAAAFAFAAALRVISQYAPGLLWDWHVFYWLYSLGFSSMAAIESWGWVVELTPAFFGAGILSGLNASLSFFAGSIIAWAICGPLTVHFGFTAGVPASGDLSFLTNYNSLSLVDPVNHPSPRYWSLWVGVMLMTCSSFAEVFCNGHLLFSGIARGMRAILSSFFGRPFQAKQVTDADKDVDNDPSPLSQQIPKQTWVGGVVFSVLLSCLILWAQYDINPLLTLLSVILAFLFAVIAVQSSGVTDINPVSTCAKSSQLVIGGITQTRGYHDAAAQRVNLVAGVVAAGAAAQSVDMLGDLKTGYLLSASPRVQFYAQLAGSFCSIWLCTGFFLLFAEAYPCILQVDAEVCQFGIPSVAAWRAVAIAVTGATFPVPKSSWITALLVGALSVLITVLKNTAIPVKYRHYVPNMNAIGLAFTLPQTWFSTAMALGSIFSMFWWQRSPDTWRAYSTSLAAGLCAGEGIGGVINALLTISGFTFESGTTLGCPGRVYCG